MSKVFDEKIPKDDPLEKAPKDILKALKETTGINEKYLFQAGAGVAKKKSRLQMDQVEKEVGRSRLTPQGLFVVTSIDIDKYVRVKGYFSNNKEKESSFLWTVYRGYLPAKI